MNLSPSLPHRPLLGLALALTGLAGCDAVNEALTPRDSDEARAAVESMTLTRLEASLLMAVAEQTPLGMTPAEMATIVEAALPTVFSPADCVRAEAVDATVTMTLDGCTGPRALSISGIVNVVWALDAMSSVLISVTATDLEIGGASMTINATGTYERTDAIGSRAAVTTEGIGRAGANIVGRLGAYVVTWNGACFDIDGEWTSSLDQQVFLTSVNDYYGCDDYCPAAGTIVYGKTEAEGIDQEIQGEALTITYIGDEGAPWVATDGSFGRQELTCTEDPDGREPPSRGDGDIDLD